jgi:hypothetical protein
MTLLYKYQIKYNVNKNIKLIFTNSIKTSIKILKSTIYIFLKYFLYLYLYQKSNLLLLLI